MAILMLFGIAIAAVLIGALIDQRRLRIQASRPYRSRMTEFGEIAPDTR